MSGNSMTDYQYQLILKDYNNSRSEYAYKHRELTETLALKYAELENARNINNADNAAALERVLAQLKAQRDILEYEYQQKSEQWKAELADKGEQWRAELEEARRSGDADRAQKLEIAMSELEENKRQFDAKIELDRQTFNENKREFDEKLNWDRESFYSGQQHEIALENLRNQNELTLQDDKQEFEREENDLDRSYKGWELTEGNKYDAWKTDTANQYDDYSSQRDQYYNRQNSYDSALYDVQNLRNQGVLNAGQYSTQSQIDKATGSINEAMSPYQKWLAQGGVYSQQEMNDITGAAYNDARNAYKSAGESVANSFASKGLSTNPYATQILNQQSQIGSQAARGAARADILDKQVSSRQSSADALAKLLSERADYETKVTQEGYLGNLGNIKDPTKPYNDDDYVGNWGDWGGNTGSYTGTTWDSYKKNRSY